MEELKRRYKETSLRDKRSIVRALNTFSKQYNIIECQDNEVDLNKKPMTLKYLDSANKYSENIIYSHTEAMLDLKNIDIILDTIDNLLSINQKKDFKNKIKKAVLSCQSQSMNSFFLDERKELSILDIKDIVKQEGLAKRIYSQIKNRIMFFRSGIYSNNENKAKVVGKIIYTKQTNTLDILQKQLNFSLDNLYLFEEETKEKVLELTEYVNNEKQHKYFNQEHKPHSNNTSEFHPIDEEAYNDIDNKHRQASMTVAMIDREEHGLYDEDTYSQYNKIAKNYEEDKQVVVATIVDLLSFLESKKQILREISKCDDNIRLKYRRFFSKIEEHQDTLLEIIEDETDGEFTFDLGKKDKFRHLTISDLIELQDSVASLYNCSIEKLEDIEDYVLSEMHLTYGLGSSVEELKLICTFDRYSHPYYKGRPKINF